MALGCMPRGCRGAVYESKIEPFSTMSRDAGDRS